MENTQIGLPFLSFENLDSTNEEALRRIAKKEVKEGTAIFAHYQSHGKGQRERTWLAEPGDNINLSLVLCPNFLSTKETFILNMLISLAVYDFYSTYAGSSTCLKWSNDLYYEDKKAGGMLIENIFRGSNWRYAVVGIGINLNQLNFEDSLPNPISLRQLTDKVWNVEAMAKELCVYIEKRYGLIETTNTALLKEEYESCLFRLNQPGLFERNGRKFEAIIRGVEKNGRLLLEQAGKIEKVNFGDIKFVV